MKFISGRAPAVAVAAALLLPTLGPVGTAAAAKKTSDAVETWTVGTDGRISITGSGWGHGRGMSQWGAYQGASEGATFSQILSFYYPSTTVQALPARPIRVLVNSGNDLVVRAASGLKAVGADGANVPLTKPDGCPNPVSSWRARSAAGGVRLDAWCGTWVSTGAGRTTIAFANSDGFVATRLGSLRTGYRGSVAARVGSSGALQVVNTLLMEDYLRAVVPTEVSPSWPTEALKAQAVAARSYAATEALAKSSRSFDVYNSTRSQAYPGALTYDANWGVARIRESARTDAAVAATSGLHVTAAGLPVLTQFSASNGGATASSPLAHMVAATDDWDSRATRNPRLAWTRSIGASELGARLGVGDVQSIQVLGREGFGPWGGRVRALRLIGTAGTSTLTGDSAIRSGLGVYSSMLQFG